MGSQALDLLLVGDRQQLEDLLREHLRPCRQGLHLVGVQLGGELVPPLLERSGVPARAPAELA